MYHITLATGDTRDSPRSEVRDDVIAAMRPWLLPGEHALPVPGGYRLVVPTSLSGAWLGTVYQETVPVATIGVAGDETEAARLWAALVKLQESMAPVAAERPSAPWVGVALLAVSPATMDWLADFERCLAWAWIEENK